MPRRQQVVIHLGVRRADMALRAQLPPHYQILGRPHAKLDLLLSILPLPVRQIMLAKPPLGRPVAALAAHTVFDGERRAALALRRLDRMAFQTERVLLGMSVLSVRQLLEVPLDPPRALVEQ